MSALVDLTSKFSKVIVLIYPFTALCVLDLLQPHIFYLLCNLLISNEIEYLCTCFLLCKVPIQAFLIFLLSCLSFSYCFVGISLHTLAMNLFVGYIYWQHHLPLNGLSFHSFKGVFCWIEITDFNVFHFISHKKSFCTWSS